MLPTYAAFAFLVLTFAVVAFQLALAAGAPWGALTLGGKFPGRLPARMRPVPIVSAVLLLVFAGIVAARVGMLSGLAGGDAVRWAIWGVVAYCALGVVANAATPSRNERRLWLPVVSLMLASSLIVALA